MLRLLTYLGPGLASCLLSGCMTHALWTNGAVESFAEPSVPNHLALFADPTRPDVLARYEEWSPWGGNTKTRSYFIRENGARIRAAKPPHFVNITLTNGLASIPLYPQGFETLVTNIPLYAVTSPNANQFTIISSNATWNGSYELPTYRSTSGRVKLVLLTPLTVVMDISIVGGVIGYIGLNALASGGGSQSWSL